LFFSLIPGISISLELPPAVKISILAKPK
jgi:hypothetical protein